MSQKSWLSIELGSWLACSSSIALPAQACAHPLTNVPAALAGTAIEAVASELLAISQRAQFSPPSAPSTAAPDSVDTSASVSAARLLVHISARMCCCSSLISSMPTMLRVHSLRLEKRVELLVRQSQSARCAPRWRRSRSAWRC